MATNKTKAKGASQGGGFFHNLLSSIFGARDPDAEKRNKLKAIAKNLSKTRFHFYKPGASEVLPAFAKYFYDIYKVIAPAQAVLQNLQNEKAVQRYIIEYSLDKSQRKIVDELTEENIIAKSKTTPLAQLSASVKQQLETFGASFTSERIAKSDSLYKNFLTFKEFVMFDFYFLLRKFDPALQEKQFTDAPHFNKCGAEYVVDSLKDLSSIVFSVTQAADWNALFDLLKDMKGVSPIAPNAWKKVVARLAQLRQSGTLDMMVELASENPDYVTVVKETSVSIVDPFIDKFKGEAMSALRQLESEVKTGKVNDLLSKLFGSTELDYMKNYTEQIGGALARKNLDSFMYCDAMNYLKGFLLEFVKKDIREYCELVLVRGQWTSNSLAAPMSDAYNALLAESDKITQFDNELADDAPIGMKYKTYLPRAGHDKEAINVLNRLTSDANEASKEFISESARNLITVGKTVKSLLEDEPKKSADMIINWKEIERASEKPLKELGVEVYKKIYLFVTLMQTCVGRQQ